MISKGAAARVTWLRNRLSCMSVPEVFYRIEQALVTQLTKRGLVSTATPLPSRALGREFAILPPPIGIEPAHYCREADAILNGQVILFAARCFDVGSPPQWNRDPLTGIVGPSVFGGTLSITNRALVGDIKHVWELNRHLHLVRLAQAFVLSGEQRYLDGLASQLHAWLEQCPPQMGPNWTSSLEAGIRLINWSIIWQMLGGWDSLIFNTATGKELRERWLASVFAHCQFIGRHLSRYSSANNHLIGELSGLYVASLTWPYWPQCSAWAGLAKSALEREVVAQHSHDGVNREQAFAYQVFVAEFMAIAGLTGERGGDAFSNEFWRTFHSALRFLRSVRDVVGHVPMVGDADDGIVWRLEPGQSGDRAAMLLALDDAIFGGSAEGNPSDSVRWLLGAKALVMPNITNAARIDWKFPEGGYFLFGSKSGEWDEIKGMVDCGPLGYLGIAAHGHADALALTLSIAGEECLVDPGTFSYWNDVKWRDYFRGTSAHNTVSVDDLDQSVSGGRFMWTRKAKSRIDRMPTSPSQFEFEGSHDGYMRLQDPVRHLRRVHYDDRSRMLEVCDRVAGKKGHVIEQYWHFSPAVKVRVEGAKVLVEGKRFRLHAEYVGSDLDVELVSGREEPPLGWISRAYESKEPCTSVRVRATSNNVNIVARHKIEILLGHTES